MPKSRAASAGRLVVMLGLVPGLGRELATFAGQDDVAAVAVRLPITMLVQLRVSELVDRGSRVWCLAAHDGGDRLRDLHEVAAHRASGRQVQRP